MYKVRVIGDTGSSSKEQFQLPKQIIIHPKLDQFENDIAIVTVSLRQQ